jgi:ligand-binding sensor domain-containing protein/putative methionine-R-sulfoxide reductase with GAF domain/two-component sensor histidine kinase
MRCNKARRNAGFVHLINNVNFKTNNSNLPEIILYQHKQNTLLALMLLVSSFCGAQQLNFDHINYKNGLINNAVKTIYQDKKGILYFGTNNGISIYYGNGFKNIDTCNGKKIGAVTQITGTENGDIFIVTATIPFLYKLNGQQLQQHPSKAPSYIYHLRPENKTDFLVGADDGLYLFNGHHYKRIDVKIPDSNKYISKVISCTDSLWLIGRLGSTMELVNKFSLQSVASYPKFTVQQLFKDEAGNIWIATKDIGVKILTAAAIKEKQFRFTDAPQSLAFLNQSEVSDITGDKAGNIYIATVGKGLVKYMPNGTAQLIETKNGLSSSNVKTAMVDREGNLWVGTNLGVDKLSKNMLETFTENEGILSNICFDAVWTGDHSLLAATKEGISIINGDTKKIQNYPFSPAEELYYFKTFALGKRYFALNRTGIIELNTAFGTSIVKQRIDFFERVNTLAADKFGNIFAGGQKHIWLLQNNRPVIITDEVKDIRTMMTDTENNLWVGTYDEGIIGFRIISSNGSTTLKKIFQFKTSYYRDHSRVLQPGSDNTMWYGTRFSGLYHLKFVPESGIVTLKHLDAQSGISSDYVQSVKEIETGKILIGTADGLDYIHLNNGQYSTAAAVNKKFNFSSKINQVITTPGGQLWLATDDGIMTFPAGQLLQQTATSLFPLITSVKINNIAVAPDSSRQLHYTENALTIRFAAPSFINENLIRYSYQLAGSMDTSWSEPTATGSVTFSELQPGKYIFKVKAIDINGNPSAETASYAFVINKPFYKTYPFILLVLAAAAGLLYAFIKWRVKNVKEIAQARQKAQELKAQQLQMQLEDEQVMKYFSSRLIQKNSPDDILWDVAKNVISKLGFEDCVIYLLDEERTVLIQKAAWGPKTTEENKILNPLEIPLGKGIVGTVALNGRPEIINDTTTDKRYLVDDEVRQSEIAVPVFAGEKIIGVIDSEHPRKNFYTQRHLQILTTIATLCGHKLQLAWVEEARRNNAMQSLINERKAAEARLESMRLQMNPHFLFNALNSIQQMILSGDEKAATMYLSKFSRLLRTVLTQSSREKVSLREEVETLKLYVELESLRFKNEFEYEFKVDEWLDMDEIKIPTLLIQPFVENAIWHGLLNKKGMRMLKISFEEDVSENLVCVVEDNGVGRQATAKKENTDGLLQFEHTGKGIHTAKDRLAAYNHGKENNHMLQIIDLADENQQAAGTRIIITLPYLT